MYASTLRRRIADPGAAHSLAARARRQRFRLLLDAFPDLAHFDVVDLGGTPGFWATAPVAPRQITCVNPAFGSAPYSVGDVPGPFVVAGPPLPTSIRCVAADACTFETLDRYDLAFSNSTIEHVGGEERRQQFARTVALLAPRYWVQTPNRYFPLEPHLLFPAAQFLPKSVQLSIASHWPLSNISTTGVGGRSEVEEIELLSISDLRTYFPSAHIVRERVAGLVKSIVAMKK